LSWSGRSAAILPQFLAQLLVVGESPLHFSPEQWRVVHLLSVAELVDHNIVDELGGGSHEHAVEIQVA